MSYDLAVWEGAQPESDAEAAALFEDLMERRESGADSHEPSLRIRSYVEALLKRWPDITDDEGEDSAWADGPLIDNAFGNAVYFSMTLGRAEQASEFAARLASQRGLVCYDPQTESLRPRTTTSRSSGRS
ncbi:hypothetical protein ISU10_17350 [Nocardioides agariphilus]|jgi:hypothetical protein|uniref:Uncharacterized protein n=1 Tax=Nocardioides agariphilus TaxID=433664 RepID=A0A930VRW6_9ACTN|nr:hypothetical protein [Nocardioides agariphilus]MBF4769537.1 hypothetical protein [Nocardioides agariphilus]